MGPVRILTSAGALAATVLLVSGCGGDAAPSKAPAGGAGAGAAAPSKSAAAPAAAKPAVAPRPASFDKITAPKDAGVIIGRVLYEGDPPKAKTINFGPEKLCADMNKDKPALYETLVVKDGAVKSALVSIRDDVPGDHPAPKDPVVIDQVGCIFVPHVAAVRAGQEIEYKNSDPVSHNIRGTPKKNPAFNTIFSAKMGSKAKFDTPEYGIPLKCDIHYWMSGFVHVLSHPFFAVTGDDGSFVISGVPPGTYPLIVWHESFKPKIQNVTVAAGEVKEVDFLMPAN